MAKTSAYWNKRAVKRLSEAEKSSEKYIKRVKAIYEQAYKDIDKQLASVYRNYSNDTGLDVQKLKELLTRSETKKTWEEMKRQGLDKYIKNNYKSRITRLEQIQAQIYAKAKQIYPKEELEQTMCYKGVINDSYYKAIYDTQMGTGYDFSFNKIDKNMTTALLNENWSGVNYSQRIWGNTDILAGSLSQVLGGALLSGQSIEKTTKQIKDRFNVSKYYAERLVRTETNHFNNEADAMAYEEMGINKYVFVATLDSRTSEICQSHDNKVYDYNDKETGVNFPPLHPNCRSKTRGYLGEEAEKTLKRRARNPITGKTEIIDNMSYKDWLKAHNDNVISLNNGKWGVNSINKDINDNFNNAYDLINFKDKTNSNIYNNMNKLNIRAFDDAGNKSPHYSPATNSIHLSQTVNTRNAGTVIHELGHAVDFNSGTNIQLSLEGNLTSIIDKYYSDNKDVLPKEMTKYLENINNKVVKVLTKSNNNAIIDNELIRNTRIELSKVNKRYDAPNRLSDMFSALTKGGANSNLFAKHSKDYWTNEGTRETELFAQFTYLKMTNSKLELNTLKKCVPTVYDELDKMYTKAGNIMRRLK